MVMDRRSFVISSAAAAAGTALGIRPRTALSMRNKSITLGIIGAGSRGKYLMRQFLRVPDVRFGAICDTYEPRFSQAREITQEETPVFADYREMLAADLDLHAVVVATPLYLHAEHMVGALDNGLHVYGEKALALDVAGCDAVEAAVRRSGRVFQTGLQYRYASWYHQAVRRIREGEIGRVTHVHAFWHRNYNWRRFLPDPSLERQINWRLYREYSGGLLAELGSHQIDVTNWIFDAIPVRVVGSGGIVYYRDGREIYDNVQAIYTYPGGRQLVFSSIIGNQKQGFQIIVYGTGGTVVLTLQDGTFYYEPVRANSAVPEGDFRGEFRATSSLSTQGDMPYRGAGQPIETPPDEIIDPNTHACASFINHVRAGGKPFCDVTVGWRSAVAVALGNRAIRSGEVVHFADHLSSSHLYSTDS